MLTRLIDWIFILALKIAVWILPGSWIAALVPGKLPRWPYKGGGMFALFNSGRTGQGSMTRRLCELADSGGTTMRGMLLTTAGTEGGNGSEKDKRSWFAVHPYKRLDGWKVALSGFDKSHKRILTVAVALCKWKGIVLAPTLIDHCSFKDYECWSHHPWNAANGGPFPDWRNVYENPNHPVIRKYVEEMLDIFAPFRKWVFIELGNEMSCPMSFAVWLQEVVKRRGFMMFTSGTFPPGCHFLSTHSVNSPDRVPHNAVGDTDGAANPEEDEQVATFEEGLRRNTTLFTDGYNDNEHNRQCLLKALKRMKRK